MKRLSRPAVLLAIAAAASGIGWIFWPLWAIASWLMQASCTPLEQGQTGMAVFGRHFSRQVQLGSLLLIALMLGRAFA